MKKGKRFLGRLPFFILVFIEEAHLLSVASLLRTIAPTPNSLHF